MPRTPRRLAGGSLVSANGNGPADKAGEDVLRETLDRCRAGTGNLGDYKLGFDFLDHCVETAMREIEGLREHAAQMPYAGKVL
jgi:hypothetical protein